MAHPFQTATSAVMDLATFTSPNAYVPLSSYPMPQAPSLEMSLSRVVRACQDIFPGELDYQSYCIEQKMSTHGLGETPKAYQIEADLKSCAHIPDGEALKLARCLLEKWQQPPQMSSSSHPPSSSPESGWIRMTAGPGVKIKSYGLSKKTKWLLIVVVVVLYILAIRWYMKGKKGSGALSVSSPYGY